MNAEIRIEEIPHDSPAYRELVALRDRVLRKPLGLAFTAEELAAEIDSRHFACYVGQYLAGGVILKPLGDGHAQLRQMAVAPEMQRRGIGARLVAHAELLSKDLGIREITMHARESAVPFYEKLGYEKFGARFFEVTLPHWEMRKKLV